MAKSTSLGDVQASSPEASTKLKKDTRLQSLKEDRKSRAEANAALRAAGFNVSSGLTNSTTRESTSNINSGEFLDEIAEEIDVNTTIRDYAPNLAFIPKHELVNFLLDLGGVTFEKYNSYVRTKNLLVELGVPSERHAEICEIVAAAAEGVEVRAQLANRARTASRPSVLQAANQDASAEVSSPSQASNSKLVRDMPTHDKLEKASKLFSQRPKRDPQTDIIDHLREVWGKWIEADLLTQKELNRRERDPSAAKALSTWRNIEGNSVKDALGHDIPRRQDITAARLAATAMLPRGERPAKDIWADNSRLRRDTGKTRS